MEAMSVPVIDTVAADYALGLARSTVNVANADDWLICVDVVHDEVTEWSDVT